jgi:acyl-CoA synthetase (AMP-forming)/AMP-acid ligase II
MTKGCPTVHIIWSVPPSDEAEVDAWVTEHEAFMQATHSFGVGDEPCMLKYYISKGPEKSNPMDPTSEPTGNFVYVISETYKTAEGIPGHMAAARPWKDGAMLGKLMELHGKFGVFMEVGGGVFTNIADDETVSVTTKGEPCIHVVQNVPKADEAVMDAYWKDHEAFMRTVGVASRRRPCLPDSRP